jgi:hypothetical protein
MVIHNIDPWANNGSLIVNAAIALLFYREMHFLFDLKQ